MSAAARRKGASAERELAKLLTEQLGVNVMRNLEQVRSGGADLLGVGPWAIEVKRHERLAIPQWWRQACTQAGSFLPALAYRRSRHPWAFRVPLEVALGNFSRSDWVIRPQCELDLEAFCFLSREIIEVSP